MTKKEKELLKKLRGGISRDNFLGNVAQLEEAPVSKIGKCKFKSCRCHKNKTDKKEEGASGG